MMTVELLIEPRPRDLGGFEVRRVLPYAKRRLVGPFIFFDEMGPSKFAPGTGIDVRPHPHIGLATVTYLFEGEIVHKDSLGFDQPIRPGDVNWMTAGRGIVHSERTGAELRAAGHRVHGIQSWFALPQAQEDVQPSFYHHAKEALPVIERDGVKLRLIAGSAYGEKSPVICYSPFFYLDALMDEGASLSLPRDYAERAIYLVEGQVTTGGQTIMAGQMPVFAEGADITVTAETQSRLMLLGGVPLDGERLIWWNFVASSQDKIDAAKAKWKAQEFDRVPGETEFIPLPER